MAMEVQSVGYGRSKWFVGSRVQSIIRWVFVRVYVRVVWVVVAVRG